MDYRDRWELKDYLIGQTLERRIWLFQIGVILLLCGFLLNFWYLQGVHGEEYSDPGGEQPAPAHPVAGHAWDDLRSRFRGARRDPAVPRPGGHAGGCRGSRDPVEAAGADPGQPL